MGPDVQTHSLIPAVYIHVPFCLTKCGYCSFYSVPYQKTIANNYFDILCKEIDLFKQTYQIKPDSIYFGGGTPSLLTSEQINTLIELLEPPANTEISLEANPVQITEEWLKAMAQTKVNRLSLGVQSMHNGTLKTLDRKHTAESMPERIKLCREFGFANLSLDLMYGLPESTSEQIKTELELFLQLESEHISTYLLNIDENVPFKHWQDKLPDDAEAEKQYNTIWDALTQAGFEHYELSNFAKPGFQSRHNLHYWLGGSFLGLGAGASGFVDNLRYHKPDDLQLWQKSVEQADIFNQTEAETSAQQKADFIIMQLRLLRGLELNEYRARFGSEFILDYQQGLERFTKSGHLHIDDRYVRLTRKALFVSNSIFREFV
jgi:oxygen-independent coproporphyrinogen-3 oxidase